MKTISLKRCEEDASALAEAADVLREGGLVCVPCRATYRIIADLSNEDAANRLLQSKGRTRNAPSLVFIADEGMLGRVAGSIDPMAARIAKVLWPGPITILFDPHPDIPGRITKQIAKANGKIGVRIPSEPVVRRIVAAFGGPVLVSSANKQSKQGAGSPAQVRKNFVRWVDLFVDADELPPAASSTVVDVSGGQVVVVRKGVVTDEQVAAAQGV